jgi:hypothetical protein
MLCFVIASASASASVIASELSKIWVRSGLREILFPGLGSGVKKAPDPGSGSATLNQCWRIHSRHRYLRYLLKIRVADLLH